MADLVAIGGHKRGFATTFRTDRWWFLPLVTLCVLSGFVVYATWAGVQGDHYFFDPYLSPFYSPVLFVDPSVAGAAPHAWLGEFPSWWPSFIPRSPSFLIVAFPGAFRFTCYYYRKAYYRSFAGSPPACAVGTLANVRPYRGETALMIFQNLHRYAMYFALIFVVILSADAVESFSKDGHLGIGVGSLVLTLNAILIGSYTFGCHSFRHLIGGHDDCMSCSQGGVKLGAWKKASWFNARHAQFAWLSLVWVVLTDVYVRLVSMGVIHDYNTWD